MLLLPTGEVLLSARSNEIQVYQPDAEVSRIHPHLTGAPGVGSLARPSRPCIVLFNVLSTAQNADVSGSASRLDWLGGKK
jgi:hypothetical protein